ncbi:MAG: metallopeptidase TldD-related protein [Kofleriaceae bacterium]
MSRASLSVVAATLLLAVGPVAAKRVAPPSAPTSSAVTPAIVDAIAEEMDRAVARLELPGAPKPFHISYKITEVEVNDAVASLGFITNAKARHFVNIECRVRVKVDGLDNGNFVIPRGEGIDGSAGTNLPLEATPRIARRAAWLVTDQAYKEALIQLRAKLDAKAAGGLGTTPPPVWADVAPLVSEDPVTVAALESKDEVSARAARLSALFRGQPHIRDSRVAVTSYLERRWYLSSEGTSNHDTRRASGLIMVATGQAPDGQELAQYLARYGATAADLPTDADLTNAAKQLSATLAALIDAPTLDRYSGPVLFEGEAATAIARWTLAPQLDGTPLPLGLPPAEAKRFGGELADKVGARVMAPMLSVVDDPTATSSGGVAVIGGYRIDDEGVPPQRVQVIKDGTLLSLLTARTVGGASERSNGHARRVAPGGAFHGTATNLMITGKGGLATAALERRLAAEAKAAGNKFGLIIAGLDDPAITATTELAKRELIQLITNANPDLPPPATLAYQLAPGGKRVLVRGVQLAEVPVKAWRDVVAIGKTATVSNFLASTDSYLENKIGGVDEGFVPSSGIESSVTAPDLLFKELDLVPSKFGLRGAPAVPPPTGK